MAKHVRVYVQPRDTIDCNQLHSLFSESRINYFVPLCVGCLTLVILNIGKPVVYVGTPEKLVATDPTISVNELARQLKLWGI